MAVFTEVSEEQLRAFLSGYELGELVSYRGIAEGSENSNFLVLTTSGKFILTLYERRVDVADLPFFLGLMEHLARRGINCPLPVRRRDGSVTAQLAEREAVIITFLEGTAVVTIASQHSFEVGAALAKMHLAGTVFELSRPNTLSVSGWRELWRTSKPRADEVMAGLRDELDRDMDAVAAAWPSALPSGIIHADLFPDNVFFREDKLSGLIDFYFACVDMFAYDLSVCINAWCFDPDRSFNPAKGAAMLEGYESVRPLSHDERSALPVLAHGSALRFTLTRLHDWLTIPDGALVQKRDPMEFIAKVRFHRGVKAIEDYGYGRDWRAADASREVAAAI